MNYFPVIDEAGWLSGRIAEFAICLENENSVVRQGFPEGVVAEHERWRWGGIEWVAETNRLGASWYNPLNTSEVFSPTRPDDAPPLGWVLWTPGENRVVGKIERVTQQWIEARAKRDGLLAQSDWVVIRAGDLGNQVPEGWRLYRQALRNLTQQADPFSLVWPSLPTGDGQLVGGTQATEV